MIRACAWHPKNYGIVKFMGICEPVEDTQVSHGICQDCIIIMMQQDLITRKQEAFDREWEEYQKVLI